MEISQKYLLDTEEYLASLMSEIYPNMNFTEGSNNRDLIIRPLAMAMAIIHSNIMQSDQIYKILTGEVKIDKDITNVVYNLMRNWFLSPKSATVSRGQAYLELFNRSGVTIESSSRFVFGTIEFAPDIISPIVFNPSDLIPVYNANGLVSKYITPSFQIVSKRVGSISNLKPGASSSSFTGLPQNVIRIVCQSGTFGGMDSESAEECVDRLKTSLITRNMLSSQSIVTVLKDNFQDLIKIVPIGYKDSEMMRNKIFFMSKYYNMGGKDDIYIARKPILKEIETSIGGENVTYEEKYKYLEISGYSNGYSNNSDYVEIISNTTLYGQMVTRGLPTRFIINKVMAPDTFEISPPLPISVQLTAGEYKVGNSIINITGKIGREYKWDNMVSLKAPVLWVDSVYMKNPLNPTLFTELKYTPNKEPGIDEYTIYVPEPLSFNSYNSSVFIKFHPDNNKNVVKISYYTFNIDDVGSYVNSEAVKIISLDRLVRACYLINLSISLNFTSSFGGAVGVTELKRSISDYITDINFYGDGTLNADKLRKHIFDNFPVDKIPIIAFSWSILTPDGVVLNFTSTNDVDIKIDNIVSAKESMSYISKYNISERICYLHCDPTNIIASEV